MTYNKIVSLYHCMTKARQKSKKLFVCMDCTDIVVETCSECFEVNKLYYSFYNVKNIFRKVFSRSTYIIYTLKK